MTTAQLLGRKVRQRPEAKVKLKLGAQQLAAAASRRRQSC